jgi:hypothetical protein
MNILKIACSKNAIQSKSILGRDFREAGVQSQTFWRK